jgi:hypothetical protein
MCQKHAVPGCVLYFFLLGNKRIVINIYSGESGTHQASQRSPRGDLPVDAVECLRGLFPGATVHLRLNQVHGLIAQRPHA